MLYASLGSTYLLLLGSGTHTLLVCILPALVYAVACFMEGSIHPYDVLEAEPEVVSGYYQDHGGISFMLIYLGEGMCTLLSSLYILY